jgi:hypothetical protein
MTKVVRAATEIATAPAVSRRCLVMLISSPISEEGGDVAGDLGADKTEENKPRSRSFCTTSFVP